MKIPDSKPISAPPAATHSAPPQGGKDTAGPKTGQTGNPKAFSKLLVKNEEPETPLGGDVGKGGVPAHAVIGKRDKLLIRDQRQRGREAGKSKIDLALNNGL